MGFDSYKGAVKIAGRMSPSGDYPLMQACDIQIDEEGNTLEDYLKRADTGEGGLPPYTDADKGKFLQLTANGPSWVTIEDGDEEEY